MNWFTRHWFIFCALAALLTRHIFKNALGELISRICHLLLLYLFPAYAFWEASKDYAPDRFNWWLGITLGVSILVVGIASLI